MATGSKIEWTTDTWNPVTGCTRVSAGCDHCYAVARTHRLGHIKATRDKYGGLTVLNNRGDRHFNGIVRCHEDALTIPMRWKKPRRVFVNSMSDLFHPNVPFDFINRVFAVMALCPKHTFQVLTKRPERMAEYLTRRPEEDDGWAEGSAATMGINAVLDSWYNGGNADLNALPVWDDGGLNLAQHIGPDGIKLPLPNVWLGTSVEDQAAAETRIPHLLRCPASVRFLSCEPLIGPVDIPFRRIMDIQRSEMIGYTAAARVAESERIHWVIIGGESGPGARPCNIDWIRRIRDQCSAAGVPVFVKQLGHRINIANDRFGEWPDEGDGLLFDDAQANFDYQGQPVIVQTEDSKGGNMDEWPEDLRVREFPTQTKG